MSFLVDANVLSEVMRPLPRPVVVDWLRHHEESLHVDPIVLGEIQFGIFLLPRGARRTSLERWFQRGIETLRCLDWDATTGLQWAKLLADLRQRGRAMPVKDSMIAASALRYGLTLATLNISDFASAGVELVDPSAHT